MESWTTRVAFESSTRFHPCDNHELGRPFQLHAWECRLQDTPQEMSQGQRRDRILREPVRLGHFVFRHGLAEGNRVRFEYSGAVITVGNPPLLIEPFLDQPPFVLFPQLRQETVKAFPWISIMFSDRFRFLCEGFDVLGDYSAQLAQGFEFEEAKWPRPRKSVLMVPQKLRAHLPILFPRAFTGDNSLKVEVGGIVFVPDTAGASEIRNA